jgi:protein tyrosine/serine phosphatase
MNTDDLYLGYYLHLVQDICYRHFVYDKYKWNPMIPGNVERLHKDYSIINYYVAEHYGLKNDIAAPAGFENEEINSIATFDVNWLVESMAGYFEKVEDEDIFFFTREMADEYIAEAVELCANELEALAKGGKLIESYDNAWVNRVYTLLETTLNTRDLGGYRIDGTEEYTKYGRLIRSDVPLNPSEKDIEFLRSTGITTIIDTRSEEEKEARPHGLAHLEGFDYYDIPILEGSGIPESVEAVPESYFKIAHASNIAEVFRTMAKAPYGVMFNCFAGKDRTGVNAALILWLCGIRKSDIVFDYMRTKENEQPRFELIREKNPDLDMNIVIPNENNMISFFELMEEKYSTADKYFEAIGINRELQKKLIEKLCE